MIGVDDIVVGDLVLQWAPRPLVLNAPPRPPPLELVLKAMAEASERKFRVSDNQDNAAFLLLKEDDPGRLGPRVADVVYIGRLLSHGINKAGIENSLNELQTRMSVLDERYGGKNQEKERLSDRTAAKNQEKTHLSDETAVLKKQLEQANPSDEELDPVRRASLEAGLFALRARRRRRHFWATAGAVAPLVVIFAFAAFRYRGGATGSRAVAPVSASAAPTVKFINDSELLALFPNRAVALIGPPGSQQLRFLDSDSRAGE